MRLYYLKFDSKEQADQVLYIFGEPLSKPDSQEKILPKKFKWSDFGEAVAIGTLYAANDDGSQSALPGYHVNVLSVQEIPELDQYNVSPATPKTSWGI